MKGDSSLFVVVFAGALNVLLALMKFGAYLLTGSPSMLASTYHSISDTGNQVVLLVGYYYSRKKADREHPFGHGKAVFFYSFLVSVMLFGIAGWESLKTGVRALRAEAPAVDVEEGMVSAVGVEFRAIYLAYAVLLFTILFDGLSYLKAKQALDEESRERGWRNFVESFRKTPDMPVLAVLTENAVATLGAAIALVGIFVADVTGVHAFDAAGAVAIGVVLMMFALALARENKKLLLGEALPRRHEEPLELLVEDAEGVRDLVDLRSVYFGPEQVLITADVEFDSDLDTDDVERAIDEIEREIREEEPLVGDVYIEPKSEN